MKPKLRFSNFINDYEIKDVSDITSNISSGKISKQLEDGEYNVYGSMGIIGKSNFWRLKITEILFSFLFKKLFNALE